MQPAGPEVSRKHKKERRRIEDTGSERSLGETKHAWTELRISPLHIQEDTTGEDKGETGRNSAKITLMSKANSTTGNHKPSSLQQNQTNDARRAHGLARLETTLTPRCQGIARRQASPTLHSMQMLTKTHQLPNTRNFHR